MESKIKIQRQIRGCKEAKIPHDQGTCLNFAPLENLRFSPGLPVQAVACFITAVGKEKHQGCGCKIDTEKLARVHPSSQSTPTQGDNLPLAQGMMLNRTSVLQVLTMLTVSLASINQADILPWCNSILPHFPMLKLLHTSSGTEETLLWVFITSCCHLQLGKR